MEKVDRWGEEIVTDGAESEERLRGNKKERRKGPKIDQWSGERKM